ncbi:hypothetical protein QC762_0023500 [Podospora pseudocomata]|uniref:Secreted protein n=1 Tax=Podospora pseudocomata TaxID=2093779 RepID=A0ABR0GZ26_9PEZI|nr:hypothetical protein QC762_0023500 [Podospora pseudocomata]
MTCMNRARRASNTLSGMPSAHTGLLALVIIGLFTNERVSFLGPVPPPPPEITPCADASLPMHCLELILRITPPNLSGRGSQPR